MTQHPVFLGIVLFKNTPLFTRLKSSQHEIISDLNEWLFDYFHAKNNAVIQLPPLDDWQQSEEDITYWSYAIPIHQLVISIRSEIIHFK